MFLNSTIFVLGAGAIWHYGYPTGAELIERIARIAESFSAHCAERMRHASTIHVPEYVEQLPGSSAAKKWQHASDECKKLIRRLHTTKPVVIDYFLAWNESLQQLGDLLISAAILQCEILDLKNDGNQNLGPTREKSPLKGRDDWYRFIIHKILTGCSKSGDIFENRVKFITFNYDVSLEYRLYGALSEFDILEKGDVERFLVDDRIVHVYGSVHDGFALGDADRESLSSFDPAKNWPKDTEKVKRFLDFCFRSSKRLTTISPDGKMKDSQTLKIANQWIENADLIYILGYGFDEINSKAIGLERLNAKGKADVSIMFTNFDNINTVNKRAGRLFYGDPASFLGSQQLPRPIDGGYREKSTRNVYEAPEKDFDSIESQLLPNSRI